MCRKIYGNLLNDLLLLLLLLTILFALWCLLCTNNCIILDGARYDCLWTICLNFIYRKWPCFSNEARFCLRSQQFRAKYFKFSSINELKFSFNDFLSIHLENHLINTSIQQYDCNHLAFISNRQTNLRKSFGCKMNQEMGK